jgi:hypothetical protein
MDGVAMAVAEGNIIIIRDIREVVGVEDVDGEIAKPSGHGL